MVFIRLKSQDGLNLLLCVKDPKKILYICFRLILQSATLESKQKNSKAIFDFSIGQLSKAYLEMKPLSPKASVAVIGELNVDIIAAGLTRPPEIGSEIIAEDLQITLGSASAIFASGAARLGHPVTFISKVGADDFGGYCLQALNEIGISTDKIEQDSSIKTGVTLALSTRNDRALVTYLGAISALGYDQIKMSDLSGNSHLHMTSYFLQTALKPSFSRIFKEAREMGLTTSFDPNSDPEQSWNDEILEVLKETDILFLNQTEALQFTRTENLSSALQVLSRYVPCAVIKLGAKGAVAIDRGGEVSESNGFKVEALDTTGAGDSFAAGFVSSFLESRPIEECLRRANAFGALSTLKAGGTASQPDEAILESFIDQAQMMDAVTQ
jgi:sugar/nucleoside kinase (ribokinase family)